jgi:threonine/homoserine/homoserine lactone efflux protein
MFDASTLAVFMTAAFILLVIPGPAVLYIIARALDQGRTAGIVSVLGVGAGSLVHVVAAALGLSSLLVRSAFAFSMVKYAGAAYLIFLGVQRLRGHAERSAVGDAPPRTNARIFRQGVVVNVLNPKTALFFFAFLPQFVDVDRGSVGLQVLVLGVILVTMGIVSDGVYALAAGHLGERLSSHRGLLRAQRYFAGSVFVALGAATAFAGGKD